MDRQTKIKEVYANPVGHDVIDKLLLQMGKTNKVVKNPFVANLKLGGLEHMISNNVGPGFFDAILELLNSEKDVPVTEHGKIKKAWWKDAVFYQIYPRSFRDSNGDGIGDLRGIIEKLDYLKDLGVDALWLSPVYDSPNDDNGYDIRDYFKIMEEFGTMDDFDELLSEVHARGMKLIMDLVVNHTSDEHRWFKEALANPDSKYRDYYFFREPDRINNWMSFFGGSAWNIYDKENVAALHLFSKKQMDLNWDNENVREDIIKMINRWLEKGIDGFRLDAINYISKPQGLPDGNRYIGQLMGFPGVEKYYYGPNLHKYLKEIRMKSFDRYGAFSVGETPGLGMEMCKLVTGEERKELDMVFSFDHLETPGHTRYDDYSYDLNYFKEYQIDWALNYGSNHRASIFYNNHDNPRMISKVNPDPKFRNPLAKLLAVMQFTLPGTPFVFQGDEFALTNYPFKSMDDISDVEAKGMYEALTKTKSPEEAFKTILAGTRDHARVLLPWNDNAPFKQEMDSDVHDFYKAFLSFRKENRAIVYGDFKVLRNVKDGFTYSRSDKNSEILVDCHLNTGALKAYKAPAGFEKVFENGLSEGNFGDYGFAVYKRNVAEK